MTTAIVIVNWNSKDFVRTCLQSIATHENQAALQIIVVDGASYDGCDQMLSRDFPYVEFLQSTENLGFGRCNNLGVEKAQAEYLLLLNPDTEFTEPTIEKMIAWHNKLPKPGILCPRLLLTDGSLQYSSVQAAPTPLNQALGCELFQRRFPKSKLWGTYPAYQSSSPTPVDAVSGAFMFFRTETFRKLGGFNSAYFMYAEDMDICLQARRFGLKNYHIPTLKVIHHGGGSSMKQASPVSAANIREALHTYFKINHGPSTASLYRHLIFLSAAFRLCFINILLFNHNRKPSIKKWTAILKWACKTKSDHLERPIYRTFRKTSTRSRSLL